SLRTNFSSSSGIRASGYKKFFSASTAHKLRPLDARPRDGGPKPWIDQSNCLVTRSRAVALQLFRTKSPDLLIAEAAAPERRLKRVLGPVALTAIGIGAIIGAGIFSLTGTAAAGQTFSSRLETPVINFIQAWLSGGEMVFGRSGAGPAIVVSFIVAGIA